MNKTETKPIAYLWRDINTGWYRLHFPYDAEMVKVLKTIPAEDRRYEPEARTWSFESARFAEVMTNAEKLFDVQRVGAPPIEAWEPSRESQERHRDGADWD